MYAFCLFLLEIVFCQSCSDYDLSIRCMDRCYTVQQSCMESTFTETGKYDCYSSLTTCVNQCPCQEDCPNGCKDCENSICECKDHSNSPSFTACENQVKENYQLCTSECIENDYDCLSLCNKYFNDLLSKCPCREECPNGCPCPDYKCDEPVEEEKSSILVLYKNTNAPQIRPLIFDKSGSYSYNIWFKFEERTGVYQSCSLTFQNKMFVFGGLNQFIDQISIVDKCSLKRFKSLPFHFISGGCAVSSDLVYLCFGYSGYHKCDYASDTDMNFQQLTSKAIYHHKTTRIAGSPGKLRKRLTKLMFYQTLC